MTITINGKKQEFRHFIKSREEFIELIKKIYNKVNFNSSSINSSLDIIYNRLLNEEGNIRLLRLDRWLPKQFGFKYSNRFQLEYWLERGFSEEEFKKSISEKSEMVKKSMSKFRKEESLRKSKWDPNYSNMYRFNNSIFESLERPNCNTCNSPIDIYQSTNFEEKIWEIRGCSNKDCQSNNKKSKDLRWRSFLPQDKYLDIKDNLKSVKRSFSKEFWVNKGYTDEEATKKQFEIQSNNSKKVKNRLGKSKENLRKKGYTEEEIKKICLTMANIEFWTDRGYSEEEAVEKVRSHQSNAAKYVDFEKRILPTNKEYWMTRGYSEEDSIKMVSERQKTFSKEKCIKKYGKELGIEIFNERTKKWLDSLLKNGNMVIGYSKISQDLFNELKDRLNGNFLYATNGGEFKIKKDNGGYYVYDFTDVNSKKIIEFNGDMYHANPSKYGENDTPHPFRKNKTSKDIWDKDREKVDLAKMNGYDVMIVWDSEYRYKGSNEREKLIKKCIDFLT